VISTLSYLFRVHGEPEYIRSDNGPEFIATAVKEWLAASGVQTLYIEPGSPWENAYVESFNGKLEDELLGREIFTSLREAKVLVEQYRLEYNHERPHSSLDYQTPAEFAASCEVANGASAAGAATASDPPRRGRRKRSDRNLRSHTDWHRNRGHAKNPPHLPCAPLRSSKLSR
jgi:hypothetical protein